MTAAAELSPKLTMPGQLRHHKHSERVVATPKQVNGSLAEAELDQYRWSVVTAVQHVFDMYPKTWDDSGARKFYEFWKASLRAGSVPHGAVFVPFPWRFVMELEVRNRNELSRFKWLMRFWETLQFGKFRHFIVLQQCSVGSIKVAATLLDRAFIIPDDMIVFDTRLFDLAERAQGVPITHNSVPLPLLHNAPPDMRFVWPARRNFSIHFAGSCTNSVRERIPGWLAEVNNSRVYTCGNKEKLDQSRWAYEVANSNFTLTASGTFPPTFMIYEAMQLGSLPVMLFTVASFKLQRTLHSVYKCDGGKSRFTRACAEAQTRAIRAAHPEWPLVHGDRPASNLTWDSPDTSARLNLEDVDRLMPFYGLGFRFSRVGLFVLDPRDSTDHRLWTEDSVKKILLTALARESASVPARMEYLKKWQHMFTHRRSYAYMNDHVAKYDTLWV